MILSDSSTFHTYHIFSRSSLSYWITVLFCHLWHGTACLLGKALRFIRLIFTSGNSITSNGFASDNGFTKSLFSTWDTRTIYFQLKMRQSSV
jgi:hypothetical protein